MSLTIQASGNSNAQAKATDEYLRILSLKSKINKMTDEAFQVANDTLASQISPTITHQTTEQEISDKFAMRNKTFDKLRQILNYNIANDAASWLEQSGDLNNFNTFYPKFKDTFKELKGLSLSEFKVIWTKFIDTIKREYTLGEYQIPKAPRLPGTEPKLGIPNAYWYNLGDEEKNVFYDSFLNRADEKSELMNKLGERDNYNRAIAAKQYLKNRKDLSSAKYKIKAAVARKSLLPKMRRHMDYENPLTFGSFEEEEEEPKFATEKPLYDSEPIQEFEKAAIEKIARAKLGQSPLPSPKTPSPRTSPKTPQAPKKSSDRISRLNKVLGGMVEEDKDDPGTLYVLDNLANFGINPGRVIKALMDAGVTKLAKPEKEKLGFKKYIEDKIGNEVNEFNGKLLDKEYTYWFYNYILNNDGKLPTKQALELVVKDIGQEENKEEGITASARNSELFGSPKTEETASEVVLNDIFSGLPTTPYQSYSKQSGAQEDLSKIYNLIVSEDFVQYSIKHQKDNVFGKVFDKFRELFPSQPSASNLNTYTKDQWWQINYLLSYGRDFNKPPMSVSEIKETSYKDILSKF